MQGGGEAWNSGRYYSASVTPNSGSSRQSSDSISPPGGKQNVPGQQPTFAEYQHEQHGAEADSRRASLGVQALGSNMSGSAEQSPGALPPAKHSKANQNDSQPGSSSGSNSQQPAGQSGVSLRRGMACSFCRRRKLRCSGDRPKCTSCVKYKKSCEYGPATKVAKVKALENRIAQLSDYIQQSGIPNPESQTPLSSTPAVPEPFEAATYSTNPLNSMFISAQASQAAFDGIISEEYLDFSSAVTVDFSLPQFGEQRFPAMPEQNFGGIWPPFDSNLATFGGFSDVQPPAVKTQNVPPQNVQPNLGSTASSLPSMSASQLPFGNPAASDGSALHPKTTLFGVPPTATVEASPDESTPESISLSNAMSPPPLPPLIALHGPGQGRTVAALRSHYSSQQETHNMAYTSHFESIEGLTERLGEFLFDPKEEVTTAPDGAMKKRRGLDGFSTAPDGNSLVRLCEEGDGLSDEARELLLDCFLAHSGLFFEMSIPRFRYRMTFTDRRRPALALLFAMYLWATRMSVSPDMSSMEKHFYNSASRHLDVSSNNGDRLLDCLRASMLLSAYSFTSGRFHEGWLYAGLGVRMVLSTGLHQIASIEWRPEPPKNPLLRNRVFLLPPPEDALELGERIHTFWCIYAIDRCGSMATAFPAGLHDQDITTPFPRRLNDIASGNVTHRDDVTVRDLYRPSYSHPLDDVPYSKWIKSVTLLERATKLAYKEPEENTEYVHRWNAYLIASQKDPNARPPPAYLEQAKYRCPTEYTEIKLGLDQLMNGLGEEGIPPVVRKRNAVLDGGQPPTFPSTTIVLHHLFAATHMLLNDINSLETENNEALLNARKSVAMMRDLDPIPLPEADAFCILVWSLMAKIFIKELHRLRVLGQLDAAQVIEDDVDLYISQMKLIGTFMQLSRTQAKAIEDLKNHAKSMADSTFAGFYANSMSV